MTESDDLIETLRQAQRFGFFGDRPMEEAMAHSREFARAIGELGPTDRLLDLGSGGGLPGLVLAAKFRHAEIVLLDRRQKRTDFLERAVARLELGHVRVWCRDADDVTRSIEIGDVEGFDVVTARGFGPPEVTLRTAIACCRPAGSVVISEPPSGDRWPPDLLSELGVDAWPVGAVRVFRRAH